MRTLRLSSLLWRRGGGRQWTVLGLTAAGVLVATTLALLALSVSPALGVRGDRRAWQDATAAAADPSAATALQVTTEDQYRGRPITVVELAATGRGTPPVPPGMDVFPAPGQVALSPALARLVATEPTAALGDRYPDAVLGPIGAEGLGVADQLVAVVGRDAAVLGGDDARFAATPLTAFPRTGTDDDTLTYQVLSQIAAVLLVVPTILLVGALARLTAAQREQRLAALRLAGATPGLVVALTALETAAAAAVGAVAGVVTYLAVLPLAAHIPIGGGPLAVDELRLGAGALAAAVVAVPLLAAASATVALRKVVIGPLGVARRTRGRRPRLVRLLAVPAAWVLLVVATWSARDGGSAVPLLIGLGAVIGTLAVVGPWLTWLAGAALARWGSRPGPVLAGRRITDDPRGTYRTVSGMVLAGLIAGFLFGVLPSIRAASERVEGGGDGAELVFTVAGPPDGPVAAAVDAAVAASGGRVEWTGGEAEYADGLVVAGPGVDLEVARTAVRTVDPTAWTRSDAEGDERSELMVEDMARASVVLSLAALVLAAAATAIGSTASILDQRVTLARLRLAGTSVAVLQGARRWQAMVPLGLASIGAMASGAVAAQLLMRVFRQDGIVGPDVVPMALLGLAALAVGALAVGATRPVLVTATRTTPRD